MWPYFLWVGKVKEKLSVCICCFSLEEMQWLVWNWKKVLIMFWLLGIHLVRCAYSSFQVKCWENLSRWHILQNYAVTTMLQLMILWFVLSVVETYLSAVVNSVYNVLLLLRTCTTLCSKKSDAKIQITITTVHLIRINYPLSSFNYRLSDTNVANFNKIHLVVSEQQL